MICRALACAKVLVALPCVLAAQSDPARASGRVLLVEHSFQADSPARLVVRLERHVVYWVDMTGPGTPEFHPARGTQPAFVVPLGEDSTGERRQFEVYSRYSALYTVTVAGLAAGNETTIRLFRDAVETERIELKRDRSLKVGLQVGGGAHTGYRLDPTGGADPRGGTDFEACLLAEVGDRFGTCLGFGRQSFPDHGFDATWVFIEERARVVTARLLGDRRTDLGVALRLGQAQTAGPRRLSPMQLGVGVYVMQRLNPTGRRHGFSVYAAFHHGRIGDAPETERLDSNRLMVGMTWTP